MFKEYNIMNSFTLECSFYGKEIKNEEEASPSPTKVDNSIVISGLSPSKLYKKKKYEHMTIAE